MNSHCELPAPDGEVYCNSMVASSRTLHSYARPKKYWTVSTVYGWGKKTYLPITLDVASTVIL